MDPQIIKIPNTPFYHHARYKTWDDCKKHAENNGLTFASIRNQAENDAVVDYLKDHFFWNEVWLGGYQTSYDDEAGGNWAWLDGTPWNDSTYSNWDPGQPNDTWNEHHLYLTESGQWYDWNKDNKLSCLFRTSSSMPSQSPTLSSAPSRTIQPLFTFFFEEISLIIDNFMNFMENVVQPFLHALRHKFCEGYELLVIQVDETIDKKVKFHDDVY